MPQTATSWAEEQENLKAAKALATFLDLGTDKINLFRSKYPNFMLEWPFWQSLQKQAREVWDKRFPQKEVLQLLSAHDLLPDGVLITATADEAGKIHTTRQSTKEYKLGVMYKRAILFLFTDSWRAKTCRHCGKHFVARKPGNKYHSLSCAADYRNRVYKPKKWAEHKDETNARRRRDYAKQKLK
jgi:hypothetical protein